MMEHRFILRRALRHILDEVKAKEGKSQTVQERVIEDMASSALRDTEIEIDPLSDPKSYKGSH